MIFVENYQRFGKWLYGGELYNDNATDWPIQWNNAN